MSAFDTALTPVAVTPSDTNNAALDPANTGDAFVYVDVANIGASGIMVRVGVTPDGGSLHWKVFDVAVPVGDALSSLGPYFIQAGDVVTVRTNTANDAVFSLTGTESS